MRIMFSPLTDHVNEMNILQFMLHVVTVGFFNSHNSHASHPPEEE